MGWKWDDLTTGVDALVRSKKEELADTLAKLVLAEEANASESPNDLRGQFHRGRASAFAEVRDAVKPT